MSPLQEKKFLLAVLRRLDRPAKSAASFRIQLVLSWLVLVLLLILAFSVAPLLPPMASSIVLVSLGAIGTYAYLKIAAPRGWQVLRRFLDRSAVEARINELGP